VRRDRRTRASWGRVSEAGRAEAQSRPVAGGGQAGRGRSGAGEPGRERRAAQQAGGRRRGGGRLWVVGAS
jgi:hypothetical protein